MSAEASNGTDCSVCWVTVPSLEVGKRLAQGLVQNQLAACVNIIPGLTSVYSWEGKIQEDSELLLMIKTQTRLVPDLTAFVTNKNNGHTYDVPEVISVPIAQGHIPYLNWIKSSTTPSDNN
eukprot:TRINITY_DN884_c0_g1_i1.p1 TRINITY_DN884_c0_g1~~TRINITY_DN884_c0_g1_i1.p1  ORF type:complete len:121 (+),score=12.64 TRINITY_DN884_c0_g1_i1:93-455(+)